MPVKSIRRAISGLCRKQNGATIPETAIFLIGVIVITMIVIYCTSGNGSASTNPSTFKPSPGTFSPITDLEANRDNNPERVYSTVKGAIADLNSRTENTTPGGQYNLK